MNEARFVLTDEVWVHLERQLLGKQGDVGATSKDNRLFLEAVLWRVRTGSPWRDLPADFGNWNSVFRRFHRWAEAYVFERIFKEINSVPDFEYSMIDGTIVQAHQKASGEKGGSQNQAIGRLRGGLTTKIAAVVDALGNLTYFVLLPGQAQDMKGVEPLIDGVDFDALLADKAFDADCLLEALDKRGASAIIPSKANRKFLRDYDKLAYKWRHLIENFFAKI